MPQYDAQQVYEEYAKPVYYYLLEMCRNEHDAEELTAETFYQALRSIDTFRGECKLQTWLFQISKHVWYKELQKRKRRGPLPDDIEADSADTPESIVDEREQKLELYRRMQQLDDTTREVIYLRIAGELSFAEIGEVLGKSESWARVTFYRGKERMKKHGK